MKYLLLNSLTQSSIKLKEEVFVTLVSEIKATRDQYHEIPLIIARFYYDSSKTDIISDAFNAGDYIIYRIEIITKNIESF